MEFFARLSRLSRFEEGLIARGRRLLGDALALGDRISHQVSRAIGDVASGPFEVVSSAPPVSQSSLSIQEDETLASSSFPHVHHVCSEASSETQGPGQTDDSLSDLVPESSSSARSGLSGAPLTPASLSSSQDVLAQSPQAANQQTEGEDTSDAQGPEQKHDVSKDVVPAALEYELVSSSLLVKADVSSLLYERGLSGGIVGDLPAKGEDLTGREEGAGSGSSEVLAEPSKRACRIEERKGGDGLVAGGKRGSTICDLDADCLVRIMSHLGNPSIQACSLVCREWLSLSNAARDHLRLQGAPRIAALPRCLSRFDNLRVIHLANGRDPPKGSRPSCPAEVPLELVARSCPRLVALILVRCGVASDSGLAAVLKSCPDLTKLRMDHCEGFSGAAFGGVRCKLAQLSLHYCGGLTSAGLEAVASACPGLREVTVKMEGGVADLAAGLERVAVLCPGLEKFASLACGVTDNTLRTFAAYCPMLTDVCVAGEPGITDKGVAALRRLLSSLDRLTLSGNSLLFQVPRSGRFLRLKVLEVARFLDTPDIMLRQLSEEVDLEELRLVGCPALTDATVRKILFGCRQLRRLMIADCHLVTSEILRAHQESGSRAKLEIRRCNGVKIDMLSEEMRLLGKIEIM